MNADGAAVVVVKDVKSTGGGDKAPLSSRGAKSEVCAGERAVKRSIHSQTCGGSLPTVGAPRDNCRQETTNASRPQTNGAGTPVRGLADRLETTDS